MTELAKQIDDAVPIPLQHENRFELSRKANELRKNGEFQKALAFYRELAKDNSDLYAAAGLLHCLRKLRLFEEALPLCTDIPLKCVALDWYRNEVIWTLVQGKLNTLDDKASLEEVISTAESILSLEPKETATKWSVVRRVLKAAKSRRRWDIVSKWIDKVNPEELSTTPMKDDRGRDGWCDKAVWYNFRIRSETEVGEKEQAILIAQDAVKLFPQQGKFFKRLEALATFRLGKLGEAEGLYNTLCCAGRSDWWILHEHANVLWQLGRVKEALTLMCKAALSNKKIDLLVSLFSDIGFLCHKTELKQDARNHLVLCKYIREEQGWSIPQAVRSAIAELDKELLDLPGPLDLNSALAECQKFWRRTAGAQNDSREPSIKGREAKKMLKGKLKMGPTERPYCFILSDTRESYFCLKSDLPKGAIDDATLQFDAMPSFDKKKNQESWKAVKVRTM